MDLTLAVAERDRKPPDESESDAVDVLADTERSRSLRSVCG